MVYEIEADPEIGPVDAIIWTKRHRDGDPVDPAILEPAFDDFIFESIENHYKVVNQKLMLLCKFKSGYSMYYPVSTSYLCAREAQISSRVIDDYLVKHKLVNPEAPKKNRWLHWLQE